MTRMVSLNTKIKQLEGLLDTKDLAPKDNNFLHSISVQTDCGRQTGALREKQIAWIDDLWSRNFA